MPVTIYICSTSNIKNSFMRIIVLFIAASLLASCNWFGERISGNGHVTTQQKNVSSFNSIEIHGPMNVLVKQDSNNSVQIEADENLIPYIDVYTNGSTLIVQTKDGYNLDPSKPIVVHASAPEFKNIAVSGSGDVQSANVLTSNNELNLHVSGSGNITMQVNVAKVSSHVSGSGDVMLKGTAKDFSASISGSGNVKCIDLTTDNASLDLTGSADAQITANQKLDIQISGSGSVRYKGNASVNQHVSGSGSVEKVS